MSSGGGAAAWAATHGLVGIEVEYAAVRGAQPLRGPWLPDGQCLGPLPEGEAPYPQCVHDAARAVRLVRHLAADGTLHLDGERVCVLGFSAGGHIAGVLATLWDDPKYTSCPEDELASFLSCRRLAAACARCLLPSAVRTRWPTC